MWDGLSVEKTDNCGFSVEIHIPIPPSQLLGLEVYNEKENRPDFPERKKYKLLSMIQGPSPNGFIVERIDSFQKLYKFGAPFHGSPPRDRHLCGARVRVIHVIGLAVKTT
jgi:hypothetical protein